MKKQVEKIRKEIERIKKYYEELQETKPVYEIAINMADELLSFIDSLQEEPVREKELTKSYLAVFEKKYPIMPTLKGKQLADFKNFLNKCQQEFGLKEYGIHPTQAKLFEKLALLWATWGAEHLQDIGKNVEGEQDEEPVSENLEAEANRLFGDCKVRKGAFCLGVNWKEQQMIQDAIEREVKVDAGGYPYIDATELYDYKNDKPLAKAGDKVKVLIIKE